MSPPRSHATVLTLGLAPVLYATVLRVPSPPRSWGGATSAIQVPGQELILLPARMPRTQDRDRSP